jgi:hypothetical protein
MAREPRELTVGTCRVADLDQPGRVYFLTLLKPLAGDNRSVALTARSASLCHGR